MEIQEPFITGNRSSILEILDFNTLLPLSVINRKDNKREGILLSREDAINARDWLNQWIEKTNQQEESTDENNR